MIFRFFVGISVLIVSFFSQQADAQTGSILRECWKNIAGVTIASLTSSANYPDAPTDTNYLTTSFEAPANWNDNYGTRIRGYVHPPITGNYIFWIASDDYSELFLSADDKQAHKTRIAYLYGYASSQQWGKDTTQQSKAIYLEAGKRYYIEALHKDGTQNDNLAVGWMLPNGTYERPIPASRLSPVADNEDYSLWSDSIKITMNTTSSGANITTNVVNFPVLIRLDESNFNFGEALPDGRDVRFAKENGTHLKYQIEMWDTTEKKAALWVKVDTVFGNDSTHTLTMLWGNSSAVNMSNSGKVFDTLGSFRSVWHMQQDPSGTAPQMGDATLYLNNGTAQGAISSANRVSGVSGFGLDFDGINDYVSTALQVSSPNTFTLSCWFKTTSANGGMILGFGGNQVGASSSKDRQVWLDTLGKVNFGVWNGALQVIKTTASYNDALWHCVTAQLSSSGMKLYVDGVLQQSNSSVTSAVSYSGYWRIAYDNMAGWTNIPKVFYTQGNLDEISVAHTARSDGWIRLQYESQKVSTTFLSLKSANVKPLVTLISHTAAVAETTMTTEPFSVKATTAVAKTVPQYVSVNLSYGGTATGGTDYLNMPTAITVTIPADSLQSSVKIAFTPIEDSDDEGNEYVSVKIVPDTTYRVGAPDSTAVVITDNDQVYPPEIILEPKDTSVLSGDVATFIVNVAGSPPFDYLWHKNNILLATAPKSAQYTTPPVAYSDSGAVYSCIVLNSVGRDTSRAAKLTVSVRPEAPRILRQPLSQTLAEGDTAKLSVVAAGSPPFSWQWYCGTTALAGAIDSVLKIKTVTLSDNGKKYYCQVTNGVSGVLSTIAVLTVRKPSSQTLLITGDLFTSGFSPVGNGNEVELDFVIKLYGAINSDSALYTESFLLANRQSVTVKDGKFALQLGSGTTDDDLIDVVRTNANLFVGFTISLPGGNPETLDRRVPLTASPYALSALPQLLKGNVNPDSAGFEAPVGTHYLHTTKDSTYIKTATGWSVLH